MNCPRPASAGFVGAFRAALRKGGHQSRPQTPHREHVVAADSGRAKRCINSFAKLARTPEARGSSLTRCAVEPCRPSSAPNSGLPCRSECEKRKQQSEWALLARHASQLQEDEDFLRTCEKRKLREEQKQDLKVQLADDVKNRSRDRARLKADRQMSQEICKLDMQHQLKEQERAMKQRLDAKAFIEVQTQEREQRRKKEKEKRLHEDALAREECARLIAASEAQKQMKREKMRQMSVQANQEFLQQSRLKTQIANENIQYERELAAKSEQFAQQQDAAREAKLQEMADDQARRMAVGMGVQAQKLALDEARDERVELLVREKYAADDAKAKRDQLAREHSLQEFQRHRKQQMEHNKQLEQSKCEEEKMQVRKVAAFVEEEKRSEARRQANKRAELLELQQYLLAQAFEKRSRAPIEMSELERQMNKVQLQATTMSCSLTQVSASAG